MRLGEPAVGSVISNTSTQKCEAFNRAVSSTVPMEVNYSRNIEGRVSAQVLKSNNTMANAVQMKLRHVTGTKLSQKAARHLHQISFAREYAKKIQRQELCQERRG